MSAKNLAIALSGGGVRAAAFHAGVCRWLAEGNLFERTVHISTVSGGSLFAGLLFHSSGYRWPSSAQYIKDVLPKIRELLTTTSLQTNSLLRLIGNPLNWRYLLSRANVVAKSIEGLWGISGTLDQLPKMPLWSINGTTAETGRRFRFKSLKIGDYELGYADASTFKLAEALAVSAAFPGAIGPLRLRSGKYRWYKRKEWNSVEPEMETIVPFSLIHLYDGGVYDNLAIEPLFDMGKQIVKNEIVSINFVIASDAGAPFSRIPIPGPLHPLRLKRIADIAFDQARALRVRSFVNYLLNNPGSGHYIQIGSFPTDHMSQFGRDASAVQKLQDTYTWLSKERVSSAVKYPTTLNRMEQEDFDLLMRHGYETANWNNILSNPKAV